MESAKREHYASSRKVRLVGRTYWSSGNVVLPNVRVGTLAFVSGDHLGPKPLLDMLPGTAAPPGKANVGAQVPANWLTGRSIGVCIVPLPQRDHSATHFVSLCFLLFDVEGVLLTRTFGSPIETSLSVVVVTTCDSCSWTFLSLADASTKLDRKPLRGAFVETRACQDRSGQ